MRYPNLRKMALPAGWTARPILTAPASGSPLSLEKDQTWSSSDRPGTLRLRCTRGQVWITQTDDSRDTILNAGESFISEPHGQVVVQALEDGEIELCPATAPAPSGRCSA